MGGLPDMLFVIDTNKEELAVAEAIKLGIPVVAVVDSTPQGHHISDPGNDDAIRSIAPYCELVSASVLDGLQQEATTSGADIGEAEEGRRKISQRLKLLLPKPAEEALEEAPELLAEGAEDKPAVE